MNCVNTLSFFEGAESMHGLRIAVIGAGSTYTPELINGFIQRKDRLKVDSFSFCDTDGDRCEILASLSERMFRRAGIVTRIERYDEFRAAVRGADYIITQIRIGKMPARILDERIPLQHGLIGQETTGLGGLSCALRTIPVITDIARAVRELASPDAWLINFSNPSGLVTEAVFMAQPDARCIGLCNIPIKLIQEAQKLLGTDVACEFTGLNHLCWMTGIYDGSTDILERLLSLPIKQSGLNNIPDMKYTPEELRAIGGFPCGYLNYYYHKNEVLQKCQKEEKTRGEICLALERQLLALYAAPATDTVPELLKKRGGAMYSTAAVGLMDALENNTGAIHVVNVRNQGVLPFLRPKDVAEIRCRVTRNGAEPLPLRGHPTEHITGLVQAVKAYERLAARAALDGSYPEALAAALSHPLGGDFSQTKAALDSLLDVHKANLKPSFFERKG